MSFDTPLAIGGPLRKPRQMLAAQEYGGHSSIHDDAMAERLGFRAGPIEGPAVGLFADQEIRMVDGPLFVGEDYLVRREIVALAESRRTESYWVRSRIFDPDGKRLVAQMPLNHATLKHSYAGYDATGETRQAAARGTAAGDAAC